MSNADRSVIVLGAGLAGTLIAAYLGRAGYEVTVFERRRDPRLRGAEEGRSINLALSNRGIHALERVGIARSVLESALPMRGRMIHSTGGKQTFQAYGPRPEHFINSVSRSALNISLIQAADELPAVRFRFGLRCADVVLDRAEVVLVDEESGESTHVAADTVIAADGAFSRARDRMQRGGRFDFQQSFLDHGYKELSIPAAADGSHQMDPNALHIWPRGEFMMIALPNLDGSFTCTLFWPFEGEDSFATMRSREQLIAFFRRTFPDAVPLMPQLADEFFENKTGSLVTIRCSPWHHRDKLLLLGDSAHAVVPFYGQGANAAFEDCALLFDILDSCGGDFGRAYPEFERSRKVHVDALADLAIANYVEMRNRTASRSFRLRKKLENSLFRVLPGIYLPLYTMVTFSRIPYADAVRRARRQLRIMGWAGGLLVLTLIAVGLLAVQCALR